MASNQPLVMIVLLLVCQLTMRLMLTIYSLVVGMTMPRRLLNVSNGSVNTVSVSCLVLMKVMCVPGVQIIHRCT